MMKRVLIIEDEYYSAQRLKRMITDIDDAIDIQGPLASVSEVVETLHKDNDYDLIFSDIRLRDGDVFDAFREVMPASFVIFTTAYDEYAMQAIKHNGLDYLMKPIDPTELSAAMSKVALARHDDANDSHRRMAGMLADTRRWRERILVTRGDELCVVNVDDISYIFTCDGHLTAHTFDGNTYPLPMTIGDIEKELDPDRFFRINRQYIANIKGIKRISLFFSSKLAVRLQGCDDNNIVISKDRTTALKEWLDR